LSSAESSDPRPQQEDMEEHTVEINFEGEEVTSVTDEHGVTRL
jgi:hypothetical protein